MRDLLSKLDAILSETALKDKEDLQAKRKALQDIQLDPNTSKDPELKAELARRKASLEKEAKAKGFSEAVDFDQIRKDAEAHVKKSIDKQSDDRIAKLRADKEKGKEPFMSQVGRKIIGGVKGAVKGAAKGFSGKEDFEVGDEFGISFSEDFEIATEIVDLIEDGVVISLDEHALELLSAQGWTFEDGELVREEKQKGVDGKACWKGYKRMGTKQKGGKTVDNCVKVGEGKYPFAGAAVGHKEGPAGQLKGKDKRPVRPGDLVGEGFSSEVEEFFHKVAQDGDYDMLYDAQSGKYGKEIERAVQDMYDDVSINSGLHPDDDFEEIYDRMLDQITDDYSDGDSEPDDNTDDSYALSSAGHGSDEDYGSYDEDLEMEAKYQGKEVPLGKKLPGDVKKSKVYVRKPNGKIVKVNFGDKKMRIKKSNPARRKSFRARHNCKNPGPRWKARYWSCRSW